MTVMNNNVLSPVRQKYSLLHAVCCCNGPVLIQECSATLVQVRGGTPLS